MTSARATAVVAIGLMASAGWIGAAAAQQSSPSYTGQQPAPGYGAQQPGHPPPAQPGQTQQQHPGPGQAQQDERVIGSAFTARVTGEVQQVNRETGQLTLSTPEGPMRVRFPTAALQNVNPGDRVTVMVGLVATEPSPAALPRQPGAAPGTQPGQAPGAQPGSGGPTQPGTGTPQPQPGTTR